MKRLLCHMVGLTFAAVVSIGQSVPLYTADYYLAAPDKYLGKEVTLAVAYLAPRNELRADGLRQLDALTYNQKLQGGHLMVLTTEAAAPALITLCGTTFQHSGAGTKVTMIHGVFKQEENGSGVTTFSFLASDISLFP